MREETWTVHYYRHYLEGSLAFTCATDAVRFARWLYHETAGVPRWITRPDGSRLVGDMLCGGEEDA